MELEDGRLGRGTSPLSRLRDYIQHLWSTELRQRSAPPTGTWDFLLINSRVFFVMTCHGSGPLELFSFTYDRSDADPPLPVSYDTPTSPLVYLCALYLPVVFPSVRVLSLGTHTSPFLATCPPDRPFIADPRAGRAADASAGVRLYAQSRVGGVYAKGARAGCGEGRRRDCGAWSEWRRTRAQMSPYVGILQWLRWVVIACRV